MLSRIKEYIYETKYQINISEDEIYAMNYNKIITFSDDVLILDLKERTLTIKGTNIAINKLLDKEIFIKGEIKSIEVR